MRKLTVYLAAGLFNVAERERNLRLAWQLRKLGHAVIVPQHEALKFFNQETATFDVAGIVKDCLESCARKGVICVMCADGSEADSGAAIELATAVAKNGRAVVYRTDFRTAPEKEVGVNAMLKMPGVIYVYEPCFAITINKINAFYRHLALKIHEALIRL